MQITVYRMWVKQNYDIYHGGFFESAVILWCYIVVWMPKIIINSELTI